MWVVVTVNGREPLHVYGVFSNPDVAHAWALDHTVGGWLMEVERPAQIADLFLIEQKETW